jgi:replicative DNA helicase
VTVATKELRKFAKTSNSTVVVLSQLKRSASQDYSRSPYPQDTFGGGAVEQNADQVVMLDHSLWEYDAESKLARTWLDLTNRHGPGGKIPLLYDFNDLTVREGMPDEEREWPTRKR